eukprot:COSAG02_NODE_4973_length_4769_cov_62.553319_4_plen_53_part_00
MMLPKLCVRGKLIIRDAIFALSGPCSQPSAYVVRSDESQLLVSQFSSSGGHD